MTRQVQTSAIATLYTFAIREGEEASYLSADFRADLEKVQSMAATHKFLATYGTHFMKKAKMGARYQENIYFDESASAEEIASTVSETNANSFKTSIEASYNGFSADASFERKADSSSS